MNRLIKDTLSLNNKFLEILTWVGECRPGNKTIYTVFDEESNFQVKNEQFLCPEGKNKEKLNFKTLFGQFFEQDFDQGLHAWRP